MLNALPSRRRQPTRRKRLPFTIALLIVVEGGAAGQTRQSEATDTPARFVAAPGVRLNPNLRVPLAAIVEVTADQPVRVELSIQDKDRSWTVLSSEPPRGHHEVVLLGLRPETKHEVAVTILDTTGRSSTWSQPLQVVTPPLPPAFPALGLQVHDPSRMEPGVTLFTANPHGEGSYGLLVAIDSDARVVWYYQADTGLGHVLARRNGNLLFLQRGGLTEIDWLGNVIHRWRPQVTGKADDDAIPVPVDTFHHDIQEMADEGLLVLSTEVRPFREYPSSETDREAPKKAAQVVGDVVVEFRPDGSIVRQWPLLDILDPHRIAFGSLSGFWNGIYDRIPEGTYDWSHANAIWYHAADDTILVTVRHQDAVVKISRQTGTLHWILGTHGGWGAPWERHLLKPSGPLQWPYHAHASSMTPQGTILLFDNGNFRFRPFEPVPAAVDNYSRVVEYLVDEENSTVTQVWSYGGPGQESFYSPHSSSAAWLPQTGNILIADGGRITDAAGRTADNADAEGVRRWARILEVTHTSPARKVFEILVGSPSEKESTGWSVYRSQRLDGPFAKTRPGAPNR